MAEIRMQCRCASRNDLLNGRTDGVGHHGPARPERLVMLDSGITRSLMLDLRV
jgi:hypothetical protein